MKVRKFVKMIFRKRYFIILFLLICNFANAQNYQAINGSSYAGSLSVCNNPAAIVHVPYAWDITPLAIQAKHSTNGFTIENYALLSSPKNAEITLQNGLKKRFLFASQDIRLLNTRISLNAKAAISFGATIRNYSFVTNSQTNLQDTTHRFSDFMKTNINYIPFSGELRSSAWAELYAGYAQTIIDDGDRVLNAGLTLKLNRAFVGGYANANDINFVPSQNANLQTKLLTSGNLQYGYADNLDDIDNNLNGSERVKKILSTGYSGLSADVGFEYLLLTDEDKAVGGDYAYNTKIGVSVMDIGRNKYLYSKRSRLAFGSAPGVTDKLIENKLKGIGNIDQFNDSIAELVNTFETLKGAFTIYQPTRIVFNVDQHIVNNFFLNAEITIPVLPLVANNTLHTKDLNLLAITPRWELKSIGLYLPILYNTQKQLWVGGAFKAGPVLLGTHNLANLFAKNTMQTGGLYIAITIRPGKLYDRNDHYPKGKSTLKGTRNVECPKF